MLLAQDTVTGNMIDAAANGENDADADIGGNGGSGGGVYNDNSSTVTVAQSTISDNFAGERRRSRRRHRCREPAETVATAGGLLRRPPWS